MRAAGHGRGAGLGEPPGQFALRAGVPRVTGEVEPFVRVSVFIVKFL